MKLRACDAASAAAAAVESAFFFEVFRGEALPPDFDLLRFGFAGLSVFVIVFVLLFRELVEVERFKGIGAGARVGG